MTSYPTTLRVLSVMALLVFAVHPALAESTIVWIEGMTVTALSADGSVATGNTLDGNYTACRWTEAGGLVNLGQSSGELFGRTAGIPGISADGTRISGTIASLDTTIVTQGRWTLGLGWEETMPPLPPGGLILDESTGSAWGLSGDGSTVVGFAWLDPGRANASAWTAAGGMVILGGQTPGYDSRANSANNDGSVVVGWSSTGFGEWQPTVWEDRVLTVLHDSERWCEAKAVNPAGTMIVGSALDTLTDINSAAMWIKNGSSWDEIILGALPGSFGNGVSDVYGLDLSSDGTRVVGLNQVDSWNRKGFVWDVEKGITKAEDYLADFGIAMPDSYRVKSMNAISEDGLVLAGTAYNPFTFPSPEKAFLVTLNDVSAVPRTPQASFTLGQATPNPFNPSTTIALTLAQDSRVQVHICDLRGRLIRTLHDGMMPAGERKLRWDGKMTNGRSAPSGTYFARALDEEGQAQTRRMMLVK